MFNTYRFTQCGIRIFLGSRSEGQQLDGKPSNSPHLALLGQDQTHAAADFPTLERDFKKAWLEVRRYPHPRCLLTCINSITRQPTFRSSAK